MGTYRPTRNLEASIIDHINSYLTGSAPDWEDLDVVKTWSQIEEDNLTPPIICVRSGVSTHGRIELGSDSTLRNPQILIDVFASSDGQKLDLADWLVSILKGGCTYYEYTIVNGAVDTKTESGRIRLLDEIDVTPVNDDTDKNTLDPIDRYRMLLTLSISTGQIEA